MAATRQLRRIPGFGWSIETSAGALVGLLDDRGTLTRARGELVGTKEAAARLGVRPPNFVRDWASRADFPAPVATLSSGRVWSAAEVDDYGAARHAPAVPLERALAIARRVAWWQEPERTLAQPHVFAAQVMAHGTLDDIRDVEQLLGRSLLREALVGAPAGIFDHRSWSYWLLVMGLDRSTPLPVRRVP